MHEHAAIHAVIVDLIRHASVEMNVQDVRHLEASQLFLNAGRRVYVSHLPRQSWDDTIATCRSVRSAGYEPIPHIPARLLTDEQAFDELLARMADAGVCETLLLAGDYAQAAGPYHSTSELLRAGCFEKYGFHRVSIAGHPEGHPKVADEELRRAECERVAIAEQSGIAVKFVTQFFFEAAPFMHWVAQLRAQGVRAPVIAGLAGPASLTTLFKFALRCGAGPSIRALGARPNVISKLLGEHGPESVVIALARARASGAGDFDGIHLFSFGGFLRTCRWLHAVGQGRFALKHDSFEVSGA